MNIRPACESDIPRLGDLLLQVCRVHNQGADSSKDTASDSDANKEQIQVAIEELLVDARELINIIDSVNVRVTNLAASTQEIAASADLVNSISGELKTKLKRLKT